MATAYAPGLRVAPLTRHRARRLLPIQGDVLVEMDQHVDAQQVVAQTLMPGDLTPLNIARLLAVPPAEVPACMLKQQGDRVEPGDKLARTKGIFGMFKSEYVSQVAGTIESVSSVTGQVIVRGAPLPLQVRAYLTGTVVDVVPNEGCVIEADVALVQGIFGVGGEAFGVIRLACQSHDQELTEDLVTSEMKGAVVIGGARMTERAIAKARAVEASAIVSGGMDDQDLKTLLGYDLGVAVTGSEPIGLTVVITEGFGEIAMAERTFRLLAAHAGDTAAVNGTTQIRAGVIRPEIVVPLPATPARAAADQEASSGVLEVGKAARVIRDPYFGLIGSVAALPSELNILPSGSKARVLDVRFSSGEVVRVPRANVELIEE
jgi:hypothetical protein